MNYPHSSDSRGSFTDPRSGQEQPTWGAQRLSSSAESAARPVYNENADAYNTSRPVDTDTRNYTDMSHRKEELDLDSHNTNPYFSMDDDQTQGGVSQQGNPEHRAEGLSFEEIRRRNRENDQGHVRR